MLLRPTFLESRKSLVLTLRFTVICRDSQRCMHYPGSSTIRGYCTMDFTACLTSTSAASLQESTAVSFRSAATRRRFRIVHPILNLQVTWDKLPARTWTQVYSRIPLTKANPRSPEHREL